MTEQKLAEVEKLRGEVESWKETCEVLSDQEIMNSIQVSLKQIASGEGIPLSQL